MCIIQGSLGSLSTRQISSLIVLSAKTAELRMKESKVNGIMVCFSSSAARSGLSTRANFKEDC